LAGLGSHDELYEIGSLVTIDIKKILDRIPKKLVKEIDKDPSAKVVDYKLTDGTGVGYVIKLKDGSTHWFFQTELTSDKGESYSPSEGFQKEVSFMDEISSRKNSLSFIFNPINFIRWLIEASKDIT